MAQSAGQIVLLEESDLETVVFTQQEIEDYAEHIGIDLEHDRDLFYIAEKGLRQPLPKGWVPAEAVGEGVFYFNKMTRESVWEHPCDAEYQEIVAQKMQERVAMPLSIIVSREEEAFVVKAWSLAGSCLATVSVAKPTETRMSELRQQLLDQVTVPESTVPRLMTQDAVMLGYSHDSLLVSEVLAAKGEEVL